MVCIELGEWVKGPFANSTIEGFIINHSKATYSIEVKKIETLSGNPPEYLKIGEVLEVPKKVVQDFFRVMNPDQQINLVALVSKLGMRDWAVELVEKFHEHPETTENKVVQSFFSELLNEQIYLRKNDREILFSYYLKAVENGLVGEVRNAEDINNPEKFDAVIAAIVLIADGCEGREYLRQRLVAER